MKTKSRQNRRPNLALLPLEPRLLLSVAPIIQLFDTASAIKVADAITLTAFVSTPDGQPLDGQTLQLSDNNHLVIASAQISAGIATFNWTPTTGGLHVLVAQFPAQDSFDAAASDPVNLNVYRLPATLNLQTKTVPGAALLTVTVSSADPLPFTPTDNVNLYEGSTFLATVPFNQQTRIPLAAGPHTLSARFSGNGAFFPADATESITIPIPADASTLTAATAPATTLAAPPHQNAPTPYVILTTTPDITIATPPPTAPAIAAPQLTLVNPPPSAPSSDSPNSFGLQPEFRQFYEFQLPPVLDPITPPPQPTVTNPPKDQAPGNESESRRSHDPRQST